MLQRATAHTHTQSRCLSAFTQCCTTILKKYRKNNENVGGQAIGREFQYERWTRIRKDLIVVVVKHSFLSWCCLVLLCSLCLKWKRSCIHNTHIEINTHQTYNPLKVLQPSVNINIHIKVNINLFSPQDERISG